MLILEADLGELCCKTSLRARVSKEKGFLQAPAAAYRTHPQHQYLIISLGCDQPCGKGSSKGEEEFQDHQEPRHKSSLSYCQAIDMELAPNTRLNQGFELCAQPKAVNHTLSMTSLLLDLSYPLLSQSFLMPAKPGFSSWEEEQHQHHFHYFVF